MKSIRYVVFAIVSSLFLTACDDMEGFNLKRDNSLDGKTSGNNNTGGSGNSNNEGGAVLKFDSYSVIFDNNGDNIVNKGETVSLVVFLKNTGSSEAIGVKATFSTTSSYVSNFSPTTPINFYDISAGKSQSNLGAASTIKFTVSNTAPVGAKIPISISITDKSGKVWTDRFDVTVEATRAKIVFDKYFVRTVNNNGIVNKGEVNLEVYLKNSGLSTAMGVKATFSTTSLYVSNLSPTTPIIYGNISAGRSENNVVNTVKFTGSNSTPSGTQILIRINIVDESDNTWTDSFNIPVQ